MMRDAATSELLAEAEFFRIRALYRDHTWVGLSSDAMLRQAITGAERPDELPRDAADLARCEATYRRAPRHLQERMLPTLELFRRVAADRPLWCWECDHGGHGSTWSGLCRPHADAAGLDTRPLSERWS